MILSIRKGDIGMKKKILYINIITTLLVFLLNYFSFAAPSDIEGWKLLESKEMVTLWQKKEKEYTSEVIINLSAALSNEVLRGYSIKKNEKEFISDYFSNSNPIGLWRILYDGYDSSGNIYLKIFRKKDNLSNNDITKIKEEIEKVTVKEEDKRIMKERLKLFDSFLNNYLKEEGDVITVDPSKTIVFSSIDDIPPFKIEVNDQHSVINVTIVSLE